MHTATGEVKEFVSCKSPIVSDSNLVKHKMKISSKCQKYM